MSVYGHKTVNKPIFSVYNIYLLNYTNGKSELISFESFFNGIIVFLFLNLSRLQEPMGLLLSFQTRAIRRLFN